MPAVLNPLSSFQCPGLQPTLVSLAQLPPSPRESTPSPITILWMATNQSMLPSANCILVQQSKKERIELERETQRERGLCVREREWVIEWEREAAGDSHTTVVSLGIWALPRGKHTSQHRISMRMTCSEKSTGDRFVKVRALRVHLTLQMSYAMSAL